MRACAENTICEVHNIAGVKTVSCVCKEDYSGDPYEKCHPIKITSNPCEEDSQCPNHETCLKNRCQNPCREENPCSLTANCKVVNHRPVCFCPAGFTGDPLISCSNYGCQEDEECIDTSVCLNSRCVDACSLSRGCGTHATCKAKNHQYKCYCDSGFSGDPDLKCDEIECMNNNECPKFETCVNNKCINLCDIETPCLFGQICETVNHEVICKCDFGYTLDKNNKCVLSIIPECSTDNECRDGYACLNQTCNNLCAFNPCGLNAKCSVQGTSSSHSSQSTMTTSICECKQGYTGDPFTGCTPLLIPQPGCQNDNNCAVSDVCLNGQCHDACRLAECGSGAICRSVSHRAVCSCLDLHNGDPQKLCIPGKFI